MTKFVTQFMVCVFFAGLLLLVPVSPADAREDYRTCTVEATKDESGLTTNFFIMIQEDSECDHFFLSRQREYWSEIHQEYLEREDRTRFGNRQTCEELTEDLGINPGPTAKVVDGEIIANFEIVQSDVCNASVDMQVNDVDADNCSNGDGILGGDDYYVYENCVIEIPQKNADGSAFWDGRHLNLANRDKWDVEHGLVFDG